MTATALISVIIPVYNGEKFLAETLESIFAQNYTPLKIFVIDDGSTDGTAGLVSTYGDRVHYIYQENQGPAAARNRGLELGDGELIGFLDADDIWLPGKLQKQIDYLHFHPSVGVVATRMEVFLSEGASWIFGLNRAYWESRPPGLLPSTLLCRRNVFDSVGCFAEKMRLAEDTDWLFRVKEKGIPIGVVDEVLVRKRIHQTNLTRASLPSDTMDTLRNSLRRRRQL